MDKLLSPLLRDKPVWDAFICLMEREEKRVYNLLKTRRTTEDLIRLNAELQLIDVLKKTKEIADGKYGQPKETL